MSRPFAMFWFLVMSVLMFTACMAKVVDAKEALKIKLPAQIKAGKEVVIQCTNSISPNWFLDGEKIKGKVVLIDAKTITNYYIEKGKVYNKSMSVETDLVYTFTKNDHGKTLKCEEGWLDNDAVVLNVTYKPMVSNMTVGVKGNTTVLECEADANPAALIKFKGVGIERDYSLVSGMVDNKLVIMEEISKLVNKTMQFECMACNNVGCSKWYKGSFPELAKTIHNLEDDGNTVRDETDSWRVPMIMLFVLCIFVAFMYFVSV